MLIPIFNRWSIGKMHKNKSNIILIELNLVITSTGPSSDTQAWYIYKEQTSSVGPVWYNYIHTPMGPQGQNGAGEDKKKTIITKITRRKNRLASLDPSTLRGSSIVFEGGRGGGSNSQFGPYTQGLTRAYNTRDEICYRVFFSQPVLNGSLGG